MVDNSTKEGYRSGYVSINGRPNVGKSTFLNAVLGQKIAIVTSRPQTTRNRILGIKNLPNAQVVFLDTPGIHKPKHGLGAHMVKEARTAIHDVELVLYMVEPGRVSDEDKNIIKTLENIEKPVILLINKMDSVKKAEALPLIKRYSELFPFEAIIPLSALKGDGVDEVLAKVVELLPEGPQYYPEDLITDSAERFLVAEMVREKVMLCTHDEVPHSVAVEVKEWSKRKGKIYIRADIYVEKDGQKGIIIGHKGSTLKEVGKAARIDIEELLDAGVYLELFVKVSKSWRTKKSVLTDLGFK